MLPVLKTAVHTKLQRYLRGRSAWGIVQLQVAVFKALITLWNCSLAVMTDAAHLLSDVSGFAVALFANYIATQSNKDTHTFG